MYTSEGLTQAIIRAFDAPPNESINSIVSFESRYGMCLPLSDDLLSDKHEITLPRVNNDLLMFPVSFTISPYDSLSFSHSDPARSTKLILPYFLNM